MSRKAPTIPILRLQVADRFLGRAVCTLLQPWKWLRRAQAKAEPTRVRRVLLIKFWGIGSLQLLTPAVATLRRRHEEAEVTLLTLHENRTFVCGLEVFDEVKTLDVSSAGWLGLVRRIISLAWELRSSKFDRVYDFEFFTRFSAVVSFLVGARRSFGFSSNSAWRGGLHTDDVTFNRYWHVARNFRALAGGENGEEVELDDIVPFVLREEDSRSLDEKLRVAGLEHGMQFVVLNPNAGRLSLERRWPRPNFASLAARILATRGVKVVLIGSGAEREYTAGVRNAASGIDPDCLVDLSGKLSIAELCVLLREAKCVVTNDSGPMHLAAALGAPTLGLFGPETPMMYRPLGRAANAIWKPPICSPCINVHQGKVASCIHTRPECLVNITVDEVWDWVALQLDEKGSKLESASRQLRVLDA
ncbi:MAG: lipopolysaccharide heptosyltransferase II [Planctomycetota bacterium]|jgi:lipopolysaccharide heptosyltransferase II